MIGLVGKRIYSKYRFIDLKRKRRRRDAGFVELRGAGSSRIFYLTGTGSSFLIRARPTISDLVQTKWKSVTREAGTWQVKRSDWTVSRFMRVTRLNNDHRATVHGLT